MLSTSGAGLFHELREGFVSVVNSAFGLTYPSTTRMVRDTADRLACHLINKSSEFIPRDRIQAWHDVVEDTELLESLVEPLARMALEVDSKVAIQADTKLSTLGNPEKLNTLKERVTERFPNVNIKSLSTFGQLLEDITNAYPPHGAD